MNQSRLRLGEIAETFRLKRRFQTESFHIFHRERYHFATIINYFTAISVAIHFCVDRTKHHIGLASDSNKSDYAEIRV